ncbi:MAG: hypothetical protein CMJ87_06735 [Planctomycetes bacterium]|nr:hypothetical protein [Planctomycetota bacterium]
MNFKNAIAVLFLAISASCASTNEGWDEPLQSWGELKTVLRGGQTEGRVDLAEAASRPGTWGIGAVAGLTGEILVRNGIVWIGRVTGPAECVTASGVPAGEKATLLAVTTVEAWSESQLPRDMDMEELEEHICGLASTVGLPEKGPFPFEVEGGIDGLELHVLNGMCPYAADELPPENDPFRLASSHEHGLVVGFFADGLGGVLTHFGDRNHSHVLILGDDPVVGHFDGGVFRAGSILRLPLR